jgi:hypothetical protein
MLALPPVVGRGDRVVPGARRWRAPPDEKPSPQFGVDGWDGDGLSLATDRWWSDRVSER